MLSSETKETTTLVVFPGSVFKQFGELKSFEYKILASIYEEGLSEDVQVVAFHPKGVHSLYSGGEEMPTPYDYVTRSPHPTIHLLRTMDLIKANKQMGGRGDGLLGELLLSLNKIGSGGGDKCLVLPPSEERGMEEALLGKKIEVKRLNINPSRTVTVSKRCASVVAADADINEMAKKAFKAYVKSVHLMPNKDVFKGKELDLKGYTKSLGLATCPSLRFLKEVKDGEEGREENRERKNKSRKLAKLKMQIREEKMKKRIERMGGGGKGEEEEEGPSSGDESSD
ncbi:hypothetical protein TrRE_jg4978, partial [Triparma retinervis]